MIRRHFFLFAALIVLALMVVAGGFKVATMKKAGGGGAAAASKAKGPPGKGGFGGMGAMGRGGAAAVSVATIAPHSFQDTIEVLGVAKGLQSVTLTAAASQLVERVRFSDGQRVARGAVLVELKDTEQDAGLAQAQARLVQAQRTAERYRQLRDKGFSSQAAIDQYEAAYQTALADVNAARARSADRVIRAPFSGVVGLTDVAPGVLVNPGAPIVTLDDTSRIRVDFQVPERFLSQLSEGQALLATVDAYPGETIAGRIHKLDSRVDERTRAITARAEFPNAGGRLKPGMLVRVGVSRGVRQSLSAPEAAVSIQGESPFVYIIRQQGQRAFAEQRPIVTGLRQHGRVEILGGVQAGERIVADGMDRVQPGAPIRIVPGARPAAGYGAAAPGNPGAAGSANPGARPDRPRPPA